LWSDTVPEAWHLPAETTAAEGNFADHRTSLPAGSYICGMRIVVDFDLCESNALCMAAAPEVFEVRDDDFLYVLQEEPPEELREKVQAAVRACPKAAITVID
jgi:ferredoxin